MFDLVLIVPQIVLVGAFCLVAFMVYKLVNGGYSYSAKEKKKDSKGERRPPPPMGEHRVIAEMWDVLVVAFLLLVNAGLMIYALTLGSDDPRHATGLILTTVASLLLVLYAVFRVHLLNSRTK